MCAKGLPQKSHMNARLDCCAQVQPVAVGTKCGLASVSSIVDHPQLASGLPNAKAPDKAEAAALSRQLLPRHGWAAKPQGLVFGASVRDGLVQLFGLPLAVTSFNRWPRMLQCFFRRFGACMASMYFDDLTVQCRTSPWRRAPVSSFALPWLDCLGHRSQPRSIRPCILWHSVGNAQDTGGTTFWVRQRLVA